MPSSGQVMLAKWAENGTEINFSCWLNLLLFDPKHDEIMLSSICNEIDAVFHFQKIGVVFYLQK